LSVYRTVQDAVDAGERYTVILADPPWKYNYWIPAQKGTRAAANHYNVMDIPDIAALPVGAISHKDAWLFMWVTAPMLYESRTVMEGWGFEYSTIAFVWYKVSSTGKDMITMGRATKPSAELVLMGRRGSPKRMSDSVHQAIDETRGPEVIRIIPGGHSEKPDLVALRIAEYCGDVPRVEIFRRGPPVDGYSAIGLEADAGQGVLA